MEGDFAGPRATPRMMLESNAPDMTEGSATGRRPVDMVGPRGRSTCCDPEPGQHGAIRRPGAIRRQDNLRD